MMVWLMAPLYFFFGPILFVFVIIGTVSDEILKGMRNTMKDDL